MTVVWIWNGRPTAAQFFMPSTAPCQPPGKLRNLSCFAASSESSEMPIARAPAALSFSAISRVMSVPFVPNTGKRPSDEAYDTSSRMSGRMSGSPPEKIMILKPARAISVRSFFASAVESSSSALQPASR